ncbi:MAG: methyltransferase domain-containing protein [Candidatus Paracaedimonas acanthamoebae]|uniref:Methyltransferase domain-containing protein n=1 Tax=Candidatus Paracaedimonas acanthamoebae TaxID=244581 RepID=A0A8J7PHT3_9PROT|nr:methyltransferase domain-containing protein [Candidatus Paracaedimonas acanthamoebae]
MTKPHLNLVFDLKRLKQLKLNAVKMRQKDNFYIELIEKELITRLQFTKRDFKNIFIYGEFSDNFLQFLKHQYPNRTSIMTASFIPSSSPLLTYFPFTVCSEEYLPFPSQTFDLVISCASFHHLNNIPKALAEYRRILTPDGLFLSSFIGGETLQEAREVLLQAEIELTGGASPRIIPMINIRTASELMQLSGFSLPVIDRNLLKLSYSSLSHLFKEVKQLGESNYMAERSLKTPPKNLFKLAEQFYQQRYMDEYQRLKATLELIHLCGWNPDSSHPKNCLKGSGQISLTKIFKS